MNLLPFELHLEDPTFQRVLISLAAIIVALILARIGQVLIARYTDEAVKRYQWNRGWRRFLAFIVLMFLLGLWVSQLRAILAIITLFGAGLAIAMRETVLSLIGWGYLLGRAPYRRGDRIEIKGIKGDVLDVRMLHTVLMEIDNWVDGEQSTGRIVHIPNFWVFQQGVMNYTEGFRFIWNEISVTLTFRSDWQAAREIMLKFASESAHIVEQQVTRELKRMAHEYLVHFSILTPFVYVRIVDNGIKLTLRYLCEARKRRGTEHALTISILQAFAEQENIELAYRAHHIARLEGPQFGFRPEEGSIPSDA